MNKKTAKILFIVTQSEWGGAQRYVYDLAINLNEEYDVAVAFGGKKEFYERLKDKKIKTIPLSYLERKISPINDLKSLVELIKIIKREKPEIIHLNSTKAGILGSLAAKLSGVKKIIYTAHGWVFNEPLSWWLKKLYFYAEKISALWKNKIICVSEFDHQAALNSRLCPPEKLITIHNGINPNLDFLSREEARNFINSKLEIPDNAKIIGCIANLYKNKGLNYLIEAVHLIDKYDYFKLQNSSKNVILSETKNPSNSKINTGSFANAQDDSPKAHLIIQNNLIFIIIGEGEELGNLKLQIANCKLDDRIKLLGAIDDSYRYLKAFDLFVLTSIKEGLPYTILEAMAAQMPIISTNVGGIPEMIKNNETGVLAEAKNPQQLAEKISWLLTHPEIGQNYGLRAREKLETEFSLEKMIKGTVAEYSFEQKVLNF